MNRIVQTLITTATVMVAIGIVERAADAQPVNDLCSGATPVFDGDNLVNTKLSTLDTVIPCARSGSAFSGPDVWYSYTAPTTGVRNFTITSFRRISPTEGALSDSQLTIYSECGGAILACDEDSGQGTYSKIYQFAVTSGTTYIIRVGNFNPSASETRKGIGTLNISAPPAPVAIDDCVLAEAVTGQPQSVAFTTTNKTNSDTQGWDCEPFFKDGWFAWTPSQSGVAAVNACAAGGPANANGLMMALYGSCGTPPLLCDSSPQDPPTTVCQNKLCFTVVAGQTYYIRYGLLFDTGDATGNMDFEVRPPNAAMTIPSGAIPEPGNCTDGIATDVNAGCDVTPNRFTSMDICQVRSGTVSTQLEPYYIANEGRIGAGNDGDWYEFTLTEDQTITIAGQSEFPPQTYLYVGCPPVELMRGTPWAPNCVASSYDLGTRQASGNPPFTMTLVAGTYLYNISARPGFSYATCGNGNRYWFTITGSEPCSGACCTGTGCSVASQAACAGVYQGDGTACGPVGNPIACCPANYDGMNGLHVADIFAFLNSWFAGETRADFDHLNGLQVVDIFAFLNAWFAGC